MIVVENPGPGQRAKLDETRASRLIARGAAVATVRSNGCVVQIRLVEVDLQLQTKLGYDGIRRSFVEDLPGIPVIQADKMVRMEKSDRNWSYTESVRRTVGRDHTAEEVAAIRRTSRTSPHEFQVQQGARA